MRLFSNVEMLELKAKLANGLGVINPLIVWDEKDVVLFDTGLPGMAAIFRETAADTGVPLGRLNKMLITHSGMDHIGSLSQIIHKAGSIKCELPLFT
jgi:glyoxylase-like metal-dependent hydrolase (beta-lactamase superfamily II)